MKLLEALLMLIVSLFVVVTMTAPLVFVEGYVVSTMWSWFMVPGLHLPPIGMAMAVGICTTFQVMRPIKPSPKTERKESKWLMYYTMLYVAPFCSLGVGWIVKHYV